jgi:hypothetical protein
MHTKEKNQEGGQEEAGQDDAPFRQTETEVVTPLCHTAVFL